MNRAIFLTVCLLLAPLVQASNCVRTVLELPRQAVTVTRIYDGDTLKLSDGRRLRLIGVNTPELGHNGQADDPYAQQAKRFVADWIKGRSLYLIPGLQSQDHYGRLLGHLSDQQGVRLSQALIAEGLGWPIAVPPNTRLADCDFATARDARLERRGVWAAPAVAASSIRSGGYARVRGQISRVTRARSGDLWIDLGANLVVKVAARDQHRFDHLPTAGWHNKSIEVMGWVVDRRSDKRLMSLGYAPFMLPLRHPMMLLGGPV